MKIHKPDQRRERLPIAEAMRGTVHAVQFSETDDYLLQTLADYVAGAFAAGDAAIVVATDAHRAALAERLAGRGVDVEQKAAPVRTSPSRKSSSVGSPSIARSARPGSPRSLAHWR